MGRAGSVGLVVTLPTVQGTCLQVLFFDSVGSHRSINHTHCARNNKVRRTVTPAVFDQCLQKRCKVVFQTNGDHCQVSYYFSLPLWQIHMR